MVEGVISIKKAIPIIAATWVLSLMTTLAVVYYAPNIFPPLTSCNIESSAIITTKLADGSVNSAKILDGTVTAVDLDDGAIVTLKVADGAVTTEKIADAAINTSKIADNAIVTVKLADGAITSAKVLDGVISAVDLATGAVTNLKITDGAVTTKKIDDYAVTNKKLAPYAIPFATAYYSQCYVTSSNDWVDISEMSVTITLARTSCIIAIFSAIPHNDERYTSVRVLVGSESCHPQSVILNPAISYEAGHTHTSVWGAHSFTFYKTCGAGTYTIKVQCAVDLGETWICDPTLIVIALPM